MLGCRTIVLHATGARIGEPQPAALHAFAVPDVPGAATATQGRLAPVAVVATNCGTGRLPVSSRNLRSRPAAVIEDSGIRRRRSVGRGRDAEGEERTRLWAFITAAYPGYDDYQARTPAAIPVVVLEPVGRAPSDDRQAAHVGR